MRKTTITSTDGYYAMTADGESVRCMGDKILHPGQVIRTDGKYAYGHLLSGGGSYIPSSGYVIPIIDDCNTFYYWDCDADKLVKVGLPSISCYDHHLINIKTCGSKDDRLKMLYTAMSRTKNKLFYIKSK